MFWRDIIRLNLIHGNTSLQYCYYFHLCSHEVTCILFVSIRIVTSQSLLGFCFVSFFLSLPEPSVHCCFCFAKRHTRYSIFFPSNWLLLLGSEKEHACCILLHLKSPDSKLLPIRKSRSPDWLLFVCPRLPKGANIRTVASHDTRRYSDSQLFNLYFLMAKWFSVLCVDSVSLWFLALHSSSIAAAASA